MEDRYAITIAVGILMAILATLAVLLRFEARRIRKAIKTDDYLIIVSLLCLIGQCVCNVVGAIAGGMGTLIGMTADENKQLVASKVIYIIQLLTALGPGCTRTSIFFLYKRIFMGKVFQITSWAFIGLNVVWVIGFFFANLLACVPITNVLSPEPYGKCVNFFELYKSMVVSDIILDGLALLLPMYPVWHSLMPVRQKVIVSGIFLLGAFVVVSGILRTIAQFRALEPNMYPTYNQAPAFYWATIETGVGIISACLPTMRPLFSRSGPESIIQVSQRKLRSALSKSTLVSKDNSSQGRPSVGSEDIALSTKV